MNQFVERVREALDVDRDEKVSVNPAMGFDSTEPLADLLVGVLQSLAEHGVCSRIGTTPLNAASPDGSVPYEWVQIKLTASHMDDDAKKLVVNFGSTSNGVLAQDGMSIPDETSRLQGTMDREFVESAILEFLCKVR